MPPGRTAALALVKLLAAGADRAWPHRRGITILIYHRVGGRSDMQVDLPEALFRSQIDELAANHEVITLDAALEQLSGNAAPERDPVVLTFDDGTTDFAETALPILCDHRMPATVYVATEFIDQARWFPHGGAPLSWAALRDAVATGLVTVGSHTHSHVLLDRVPPAQVADELDRSIGLIADRLQVPPRHFAYPKAVRGGRAVQEAVRQRFASAAVAGTRPNPYGRTDRYALTRSPIQRADGMRWFARKVNGGMALEGALRRATSGRRLAGQRA